MYLRSFILSKDSKVKETNPTLFIYVGSGAWRIRTEWAQMEGGLKETGAKTACFRQRLN